MTSFIQRLTNSKPSVPGEASEKLLLDILTSTYNPDWVVYSSALLGMDEVTKLAQFYTQSVSEVLTSDHLSLPSPHPIEVFGADQKDYKFIGLLYSNGAVIYMESPSREDPLLFVFIDKEVVDILRIPYVDSKNKTVHHLPQEPDDQNKTMGHGSGLQDG